MAKRKKSGSGGVVAALVIGVIALFAAIPKEVWLGAGMLAAIGFAVYLYSQSKKTQKIAEEPEPTKQASRSDPPAVPPPTMASARPAPRFVTDDAPISVAPTRTPASSGFNLPAAPKGFGAATWIPAGQSVNVSGSCQASCRMRLSNQAACRSASDSLVCGLSGLR